MILETGYEYYTKNTVDSFLGKLSAEGYFVHDSETSYHGYIKLLGKKRPLFDCKIIDGRYNYSLAAAGIRITIDALLGDDHSINGFAYVKGKNDMPVSGGAVRRVRISDGKEEKVGTWQKR